MTTTVLLADDQPLVRMGFRMVLESQPDLAVAGEAGDGLEAVSMARALRPDVLLMDVRMPECDGIEATRRIVAEGIPTRCLVLTTFDLDEYVHAALRAGASGFLLKKATPQELMYGIRAVAAGDAVIAPNVTRRLIGAFAGQLPDPAAEPPGPDPRLALLTEREREVLGLIADGLSNGEIAARLVISEATVKTHGGRIFAKLGVRDRVQAVIFAYDNGIAGRD
ncbi:response regulator transcription factor [Spirillospora sp. NPDC029432]|uniref:response regulator transcription factor n=1 Tax=Spirillospora sp. NPDC029432 TaxID=3154599 RepID=UPI0034521C08